MTQLPIIFLLFSLFRSGHNEAVKIFRKKINSRKFIFPNFGNEVGPPFTLFKLLSLQFVLDGK